MDRCALFVDASYALADGAMAVHGTRRRDSVSWNHAGLLTLLAGLAKDRTGLPVLRCYWYETAVEGNRTPEQDALAEMPGLKLRLVNVRPGRREGIETPLRRDLVTLAKNGAISDAFIASADEHLAEIVTEVQDLGLRVVILHISSDGGWTIPQSLRQESDDIVEISGVHLRPFVELIRGAEPAAAEEIAAPAAIGARAPASEATHAALSYRSLALPPPGGGHRVPDAVAIGDSDAANAALIGLSATPGPGGPSPADPRSSGIPPYLGQAGPVPTGPAPGAPAIAGPGLAGPGSAVPASAYAGDAGQPHGPAAQPGEQPGQSARQPQPGQAPGSQSQAGAAQADAPLSYLAGPTPPDPPGGYLGGPVSSDLPGGYHVSPAPADLTGGYIAGTPPADRPAGYVGEATPPDSPAGYLGGPTPPDVRAGHLNGTPRGGPVQQPPMAHPGYPGAAYNGAPMSAPLDMTPGSMQNGMPRTEHQGAPINNGISTYGGAAPLGMPPGRDQNGPAPNYPVIGAPPAGNQPPGAQPPGAPLTGSRGEGGQNGVGPYGAPPAGYGGSGELPGYQNGAVPPGHPHAGPPQNGVYQLGPPQRGVSYGNGMPQAGVGPAGRVYPGPVPPGVPPDAAAQSAGNRFSPPGQYAAQPQSAAPAPIRPMQPVAISLPEAVQSAYAEGFNFGESVGRDAPGLWLDAVIARKPRMPSDLEARLLQGSSLPIDSLLHDEVRHSLRRGFWDSLESARR